MRTPDTFLAITRLRTEFWDDANESRLDASLQSYRDAAISWLTNEIKFPVLDRGEAVFRINTPKNEDQVTICRPYARELTSVRYWLPSTEDQAVSPDGNLAVIPRTVPLPNGGGLRVFPPVGGWPEMNADGGIWFVLRCGLPEDHADADVVRQSAISMMRFAAGGPGARYHLEAAGNLISQVRDYLGGNERWRGGWDKWVPDAGDGELLTYGGDDVEFGGVRLRY